MGGGGSKFVDEKKKFIKYKLKLKLKLKIIIKGIGSFFLTDGSTPTITGCLLEVGVVNPICLYCDVSNGYYLNETSNCVTSCIAGTYEDTDRNKCRLEFNLI